MSKQREIVDDIRRKYGLGVRLEGEAKEIVESIRQKYSDLLATIANDLNSKESHYILELIQNADDNEYDDSVYPSLSFRLKDDCLVVVNNELGFRDENVRSLCSAAQSTKKNKKGYIGEKGIGFKSIFQITDAPEIHSNGFHFRFDRTNPKDLLGYVVPHWHESDSPFDERTTSLVIPSKAGRFFPQETLVDVDGTLLLFLGKLRQLEVTSPGRQEIFTRRDSGVVTTLAASKSGEEPTHKDYLRKRIDLDTSDILEPKREGIVSSEMVLAFPLSDAGEAAPSPGCATYAFLPIRDFGFSFYIQADFVLISSREGIHEDLSWNIRLRNGIARAFVSAVDEFKKHRELGSSYLRYLPSHSEVHDPFFAPVVDQIVDELKSAECIPTVDGGWKKPAEVLIATDKIRELFPSSDAINLFGADYPVEDFHFPGDSKKALGLKHLLIADVVAIFSKHEGWFKSQSSDWKAKFYAYLATAPNRSEYVKQLQQVPCVPIEGCRMVAPRKHTVFFPLSAGKRYGFEHEISILDSDLLEKARAVSSEVESFFAELDVRHDNPRELVQSHILPLHRGDDWKHADNEALLGHVRYIKDRFTMYLQLAVREGQSEAQAVQLLRDGLWIGTKSDGGDSWLFARASDLYLGSEYRPDFDIENLLGSNVPLGNIVTSKYLEQRETDEDTRAISLSHWREFLVRIGINTSPRVERSTSGDVACCDETTKLLQSDSQLVRRQTLEALDRNWASYPSNTTYRLGRSTQLYWTGLVTALRRTVSPTRKKTKVSLDSTYVETEETRQILGDGVVYVDASLSNVAFLDACGITHKVDAQACLKRLRQIKRDGIGGLEQVRRIYRRLEQIWPVEHAVIESAFKTEGLIRVGRGSTAAWVLPSETSWSPTNIAVLDIQYPALGSQYKDFSSFFTKLLKVPLELALDAYVDGLQKLEEVDHRERAGTAMAIYRRLSRAISNHKKAGDLPQLPWVSRFDDSPVYLTHRGDLAEKSEHLYANDSPEYARLFDDQGEISFLATTPNELPSIEALLGQVEVPTVSESMTVEVAEGVNGIVNEALTRKLREMVEPIARIAYTQSHERFEVALNDGLFELLGNVSIIEVDELVQTVILGEWKRTTRGHSAHRGTEIFLDSQALPKIDYVAIEVEKLLRLRRGAGGSHAISRVLMASTSDEVAAYLRVQQVRDLPVEELQKLKGLVELPVAQDTFGEGSRIGFDEAYEGDTDHDEEGLDIPDKSEPTAAGNRRTETSGQADELGSQETTRPKTEPGAGLARGAIPIQPTTGGVQGRQALQRSNRIKRNETTKTGRMLSYLEPKSQDGKVLEDESDDSSKVAAHKRAIELAAVRFFKETVASQWRSVEEMPPNNPGFDFKAIGVDGIEEVVEIKGQSGAWTQQGVALTPHELLAACNRKDRYWLCVVEFALDESRRRLWLIQNPFGKTDQFRFDLGWKDVAEKNAGQPTRPEFGLFVDVPERGKGKILRVKGSGSFVRITVELSDKSTIVPIFNPATMKLSYN